MLAFALRRSLLAGVTLLGATLAVFCLVNLAGDPVRIMLAETGATPEDVARFKSELGYDRPLAEQFVGFVRRALRGDLGMSLRFRQPALDLVMERLPATIELATAAMGIAVAVGVSLGIVAAVWRGSLVDRLATTVALVGQSVPLFWLGISLILVFAVMLRWVPATGRGTWAQLVLPAATLATFSMARIARLTRSSLLEVLRLDYVRTARAKGLAEPWVVHRHAVRNAMLPVMTLIALQFGALLGGAIVTEAVFAWPGLGQLALQAVLTRDLPLVQAVVVVTGALFIALNTIVDLLYGCLDPRISVR
ncbi:MAG: ABC transporter permease [Candidatus Rokubacteria bacterium]|nr:ABC transporter permease [Candidatus Rokubacteria bacterium]